MCENDWFVRIAILVADSIGVSRGLGFVTKDRRFALGIPEPRVITENKKKNLFLRS